MVVFRPQNSCPPDSRMQVGEYSTNHNHLREENAAVPISALWGIWLENTPSCILLGACCAPQDRLRPHAGRTDRCSGTLLFRRDSDVP